jgi:hypothetical protein
MAYHLVLFYFQKEEEKSQKVPVAGFKEKSLIQLKKK